jgi:hypothetical protein
VHVTAAAQPVIGVHAPQTRSALPPQAVVMNWPLGHVVEQATQAPFFE